MGREVFILGLDPGFASFGLGLVRLLPSSEEVMKVDVIRTQKSPKKLNVKAADDNFRRSQAIAAVLHETVKKWQPVALAAEAMSFPRNASAAAKVAMAWGIVSDLCYLYQLPIVQATPQEIKKALCNNKSATKEDIQKALEARHGYEFQHFTSSVPAGQWEHGFDAVGAVVTCLDSDVVRMARGMAV